MYKELEMKMNHLIQNIKIMMNLNYDSKLKSLNEELLVDLIKNKKLLQLAQPAHHPEPTNTKIANIKKYMNKNYEPRDLNDMGKYQNKREVDIKFVVSSFNNTNNNTNDNMNNREEIEELLSETNGIQKVTQKYINNFNAEYGENYGKKLNFNSNKSDIECLNITNYLAKKSFKKYVDGVMNNKEKYRELINRSKKIYNRNK